MIGYNYSNMKSASLELNDLSPSNFSPVSLFNPTHSQTSPEKRGRKKRFSPFTRVRNNSSGNGGGFAHPRECIIPWSTYTNCRGDKIGAVDRRNQSFVHPRTNPRGGFRSCNSKAKRKRKKEGATFNSTIVEKRFEEKEGKGKRGV